MFGEHVSNAMLDFLRERKIYVQDGPDTVTVACPWYGVRVHIKDYRLRPVLDVWRSFGRAAQAFRKPVKLGQTLVIVESHRADFVGRLHDVSGSVSWPSADVFFARDSSAAAVVPSTQADTVGGIMAVLAAIPDKFASAIIVPYLGYTAIDGEDAEKVKTVIFAYDGGGFSITGFVTAIKSGAIRRSAIMKALQKGGSK